MDGLLNILQSASNLNHSQFPIITQALDEHQSFTRKASNEIDPVLSHVAHLLSNDASKYNGLLLLDSFVSRCTLDLIEQKGGNWLTICTKITTQKQPRSCITIAYDVINEILRRSTNVPELAKAISSNLLWKIVEGIVELPAQYQYSGLACLQLCMELYPGPCGTSRNAIEKYLSTFINQTDLRAVKEAGKCILLLQQIRGGGQQGISQKNAWAILQTQLLRAMHTHLDQIYANTAETYDSGHSGEDIASSPLKFTELELSPEPISRATQLATRFGNLCEYLRISLLHPFPVPKQILPSRILAVISRGLAVNCSTLAKNLITDNIAVGAMIPQIHEQLFKLLDAAILVLGSHVLPYASNIIQLIIQSLKWTSSGKPTGFKRPYSGIRQAAYNTLALWCKTAKSGSLVETIADELTKYILQDITPYQSEVTLKVLPGARKYLSKKARQKLNKAQNDATNLAQTHSKAFNPHNTKIIYSDSGNEKLCAAALECLKNIILSSGFCLKPVLHKTLHENIVPLAIATIDSTLQQNQLYYSNECRENLYDVLYTLAISPNHLCPPPIQYANAVFSTGQLIDSDYLVRQKCTFYLRVIEKILHPQKEALVFPPDANEIADAFKNIHQNTQEDEQSDDESSSDNEDIVQPETRQDSSNGNGNHIDAQSLVNIKETDNQPMDNGVIIIEIDSDSNSQPKNNSTSDTEVALPSPSTTGRYTPRLGNKRTHTESLVLDVSTSDAESVHSTRSLRSRRTSHDRSPAPATPVRKSTRLSSISESEDTEKRSLRDTPRRQSKRLSLSVSHSAESSRKSPLKLQKIDEKEEIKEKKIGNSSNANQIESDSKGAAKEDDIVNELASDFVDEFLVDSTDEEMIE